MYGWKKLEKCVFANETFIILSSYLIPNPHLGGHKCLFLHNICLCCFFINLYIFPFHAPLEEKQTSLNNITVEQ